MPDRRKQPSLVAAIMGSFVAALDATEVNVALPAIGADLGPVGSLEHQRERCAPRSLTHPMATYTAARLVIKTATATRTTA